MINSTLSIPASGFVAMSMWLFHDQENGGGGQVALLYEPTTGANIINLSYIVGGWDLSVTNISGSASITITTRVAKSHQWQLVTAWLDNATGNFGLWVDRNVDTSVVAAGASGTWTYFQAVASYASVAVGHVQIYSGTPAVFTNAMHLAQYQTGLTGLERQTTGERIATIASYAGVRGGEMNIDTGTSVMQRAALAGQTPLDAMRDAERTEQGLLYVDGSGTLTFKDRRSLYNI
jgi:hypothetical protein